MRFHQFIFTILALIYFATSAVCDEVETVPDPGITDVVQKFIKYRYLVIGGGLRDGDLYRAQVRIYEEKGRLMIERTHGTHSDTAELIRTKELEEPVKWRATFPKLGLQVSYLVSLYHDNFAVLVGEVSRTDQASKADVTVETAYPDIYEASKAEQD